jgi:predicted O-methyltransferase YrrM
MSLASSASPTIRPPGRAQELLERLRRERSSLYQRGHILGQTGQRFDVWPSGLTADSGEFLRQLAKKEKASRALETGFALGLSASFLIEGMLESTPDAKVTHVAVDPFQNDSWDNAGLCTLEQLGAADLSRLIQNDSLLALPKLIASGETFDFGFVDGSHLFEHIFCDTLFMSRLVRPGGLVVLDDMWMPATKVAVEYFTRNMGFTHENPGDTSPGKRFAVLRLPAQPLDRPWDHFVPFA